MENTTHRYSAWSLILACLCASTAAIALESHESEPAGFRANRLRPQASEALRTEAAGRPAAPGPVDFYSFWNRVVDRVRSGTEGSLEASQGWFSHLRTFRIARKGDGIERIVTVRELEVRPRYGDLEPILDPYFQRKIILERAGPGPRVVFEADDNGDYLGADPAGFRAELDWWTKNL